MELGPDTLERLHRALRIAIRNDAMMMVMDTLIKLAEVMIEKGEKERAVEILTIALEYPMRPAAYARAEALYLELEAELCPRVIEDAKALAQEITLDDMLAAILGETSG